MSSRWRAIRSLTDISTCDRGSTKKIKYLEENVGGADVKLSKEEVDEIRQVVEAAEVAGGRYPDGYEDGLYADTPEL
jgi:hypothetical protein